MFDKAKLFKKLLVCLMLSLSHVSYAQTSVFIVEADGEELYSSTDSLMAKDYLHKYLLKKTGEGFFNISYRLIYNDDVVVYNIIKGSRYYWANLSKGNIPMTYLGNFAFEQKFENDKPFSYQQVEKLFSAIIKKAENIGYPFAHINLDSINIQDSTIDAHINFNQGPYIAFDSIRIAGVNKINKRWLSAYLGVEHGNAFSQKTFRGINSKIAALPFLQLSQPPTVTFQNDEATVHLNLKYRAASQFDAVIGFAPGADDNLLITGKAIIDLQNLFKRGHHLLFDWRRIRPETQELTAGYSVPNLFNTPVAVGGGIDLFRQDTSFFNREWQVEINYIQRKASVGVFTKSFKSIKIENEQTEEVEDISINYFGLQGEYINLNDILMPTDGFRIDGSFALGNKDIEETNGTINNSTQFDIHLDAGFYNSFGSGFLINRFNAQALVNKDLYYNDLLRVGGINSIRGFPESYFYVSNYYLLLNEYHWAFSDGSSFLVMLDGGFLYHEKYNYALSFGLGFDLKLNNGIFELIYAVGKEENMPLSFDRSVLHISYRAIF